MDAEAVARAWVKLGGYDGAIIRNSNTKYTPGLVKNAEIIKVKPLTSLDLRVDSVMTEPGAKTGRPVYTIEVNYKGVTSKVGSGIPHAYNDVPKIGQIVQIDCLGITADGKLREPRFIGIRHDKEEPDT
jgi:DNA ligase-1